jgi:hypothetical protein
LDSRISGNQGFLELLAISAASSRFHHKVKEEGHPGQTHASHVRPPISKPASLLPPCETAGLWRSFARSLIFTPIKSANASAVDLIPLQAAFGQLTLENDSLDNALTKAGLLSARR